MKVLKRLWHRMTAPSQPTAESFTEALALGTLHKLEDAQKSHISDLRVLIDQANARETQLAGMLKLAVEERFYRPKATRVEAAATNRGTPAIAIEAMSDVAEFDEKADKETISKQDELAKQCADELAEIFREEAEFRQERGMPAVTPDA
jgi:hypothetical protein